MDIFHSAMHVALKTAWLCAKLIAGVIIAAVVFIGIIIKSALVG